METKNHKRETENRELETKNQKCLMTSDGTLKITDFGLVQVGARPSLEKNHPKCPRNSGYQLPRS